MASQVKALKTFRDNSLRRTALGRAIIIAYYRVSPHMARFIENKSIFRALTRVVLIPLIAIALVANHWSQTNG